MHIIYLYLLREQVVFQGLWGSWFFMSQHRKNSVRGKMIEKKWFISRGCLWGLQVGGWGRGCCAWELSGLQIYDQRKNGEGEKDHLFPSFWSRLEAFITNSSSRLGRGVFLSLHDQVIEGGSGHPLQYSCLENPSDRGAWQAIVHSVTKSRTWLKWLFIWMVHPGLSWHSGKEQKGNNIH